MKALASIVTVSVLLVAGFSCERPEDKAAVMEWAGAASWLDAQIRTPTTLDPKLPFVSEHYVPRLRLASERLPLLKSGEIATFVGPAYVRPLRDGGWVIWFAWLRSDRTSREAQLSDGGGALATFEVPLPEVGPNALQVEVAGLHVVPPAGTGGNTIALDREPDPNTLRLRIFDPTRSGTPADETVPVIPLPMANLEAGE